MNSAANIVSLTWCIDIAVCCFDVTGEGPIIWDGTTRRSVKRHRISSGRINTLDDVDLTTNKVNKEQINGQRYTHFWGQFGPTVQNAGQVPQIPPGMCDMSAMKSPES